MSTLKSSAEDLTLNADGSGNDVIIQSDGSTKAIVTAEGTVGIGTDSPSRLLTLYGDTGIALQNSTTGTGTGNGTHIWVNSAGSGELLIQNRENSDIEFLANDTVRMRILAAGGLCFGTDTAAANALNDYEEGTFTPFFQNVTTTYTSEGYYTKIGNRVLIHGVLDASVMNNSDSSSVNISGLPFAHSSSTGDYSSISMFPEDGWNPADNRPMLLGCAGESYMLVKRFDAGTGSNQTSMQYSHLGTAVKVRFTGQYLTDS